MKVKKIHIENYRMLKRIDIDLEENLSLIIGKNNCGKTSFLSILNKFIGSQSSTNNFTYNDFNSDFQDSLFDAINDDQPSWEKLNIKGIELYLFIEYDETDNLSNIQPLMLDLDPDNNIVILEASNPVPTPLLGHRCRSSQEITGSPTPFSTSKHYLWICASASFSLSNPNIAA